MAYLTWFTLMLGKPLLGGQVFDALRAVDYLRSRPDIAGGAISLIGDGAHGVIALYAAALDEKVRGVALRQTVTDYRSRFRLARIARLRVGPPPFTASDARAVAWRLRFRAAIAVTAPAGSPRPART